MSAAIRILHVLDHSIPLHSGYAFRTKAILEQQRALGLVTDQLTGSRYNRSDSAEEEVDGIRFCRTPHTLPALHSVPVLNHLMVVRELRARL